VDGAAHQVVAHIDGDRVELTNITLPGGELFDVMFERAGGRMMLPLPAEVREDLERFKGALRHPSTSWEVRWQHLTDLLSRMQAAGDPEVLRVEVLLLALEWIVRHITYRWDLYATEMVIRTADGLQLHRLQVGR
jgi:hypothetical protein